MRKYFLIFLAIFLFSFTALQGKAYAQMSPKGKAFMVVCAYGTVGGALLGFASMAFGTNSRAIAQGASLGLYAGIIFGTYVITSHKKKGAPVEGGDVLGPAPGDGFGQPGVDEGGYPSEDGGGFGEEESDDGGGFFDASNRVMEIQQKFVTDFQPLDQKREVSRLPPVYVNLMRISF